MPSETILALDLATLTGYAYTDGRTVSSGTWNLGRDSFPHLRARRLQQHIEELHRRRPIEKIAYEKVMRNVSYQSAQHYHAFVCAVEEWAHQHFVTTKGVGVTRIKMHATGRGNADKTAMMAAAKQRGWHFSDDNECDALWLLSLVLSSPSF